MGGEGEGGEEEEEGKAGNEKREEDKEEEEGGWRLKIKTNSECMENPAIAPVQDGATFNWRGKGGRGVDPRTDCPFQRRAANIPSPLNLSARLIGKP